MDATSAPSSPSAPVSLMGFKFKVSLNLVPYLWLARNIDHLQWDKIRKKCNLGKLQCLPQNAKINDFGIFF